MKIVDMYQNNDGTWTARIYNNTFTGSQIECIAWLRQNGESA